MLGDHRPQFRTIVDRTNAGIAENQRNQASQRGRFNLRASGNYEQPRATTKLCSVTYRDRLHGVKMSLGERRSRRLRTANTIDIKTTGTTTPRVS